jgi:hypothetical protein
MWIAGGAPCAATTRFTPKDTFGSSICSSPVIPHPRTDLAYTPDFFQGIGLLTVLDSLVRDAVRASPLCTLQGFLINSGDVSSALWSFVISVHTFTLLAGGRKWRAWAAEHSTGGRGRWFFAAGVWLFVIFISTIGFGIEKATPDRGPFCTFSAFATLISDDQAGAGWCWIGPDYYYERIFFHYSMPPER